MRYFIILFFLISPCFSVATKDICKKVYKYKSGGNAVVTSVCELAERFCRAHELVHKPRRSKTDTALDQNPELLDQEARKHAVICESLYKISKAR